MDDYRHREWSAEEIIMLWNLCMIMGNAVKSEHLKVEVDVSKTLLMNMLNNTGLNAVVSDPDTHKILWVNDAAAERYGKDIFQTGRRCYEVLQGSDTPCEQCQLQELIKNPKLGQIIVERYSSALDRTFMVYHTLIPWESREKAHVKYFVDVTEQNNIEKQLAYFATTDTLTSTTNRSTIMEQLEQALSVTRKKKQMLSIAVTNTNGLKAINKEYGFHAGDKLLENTAEAIRSCIRAVI
ncbi:MAG: diguanylate cyclase [Oxalobacter sp.]|nr:diguanylate cyclase [Oxalobacter sp.]